MCVRYGKRNGSQTDLPRLSTPAQKQKELEFESKKKTRIKWSEMKWNESKKQSKKATKTNKSNKKSNGNWREKKEGGQKKKEMKGVLDQSAVKTEPAAAAAAVHVHTYQCWQVQVRL